jgi:hypothetical protein
VKTIPPIFAVFLAGWVRKWALSLHDNEHLSEESAAGLTWPANNSARVELLSHRNNLSDRLLGASFHNSMP